MDEPRNDLPLQIEADLLLDTDSGSRRAGMRAGAGGRRQLLFRAGDVFLDLSLHRQPGSGQVALMGQLMSAGSASRNLTDLAVEVDCANGEQLQTRSNGLGEFLLTRMPEGITRVGVALNRWASLEVFLPATGRAAEEAGL